jgi:hypothetical protein
MSPRLLGSPWAAFSGEFGKELLSGDATYELGVVFPRLVGAAAGKSTWNGGTPIQASFGIQPHWDLPFSTVGEQETHHMRASGVEAQIRFNGALPRAGEAQRELTAREQWLDWMIQRYSELAELDDPDGDAGPLECNTSFGARRTWISAQHYWRQSGDESAELALIVRLAQDPKLLRALVAIENGPRRQLNREHQPQKIARIQEMDATTLRAFSQAHGITAAQKGGAKQELLAVVRVDSVDLVENRLFLWVAKRLKRMAKAYRTRNALFQETERMRKVIRMQRLCERIESSPNLAGVRDLQHHLSAPTYCLQFESRYRRLWKTYLLIRKHDRLEDDAWRWQTHLWGTTARQLLTAMLLGCEGCREPRVSTPQYSREGHSGRWLLGAATPGPLKTTRGDCFIADLRDEAEWRSLQQSTWAPGACESGADWVLVWPEDRRVVLVWSALATGLGPTGVGGLKAEKLDRALKMYSESTGWTHGALLLVAEPESKAADLELIDKVGGVTILRFPQDVHLAWDDVQAGLEILLEEIHRG